MSPAKDPLGRLDASLNAEEEAVGGASAPWGGASAPWGGASAPWGGASAPWGGASAPRSASPRGCPLWPRRRRRRLRAGHRRPWHDRHGARASSVLSSASRSRITSSSKHSRHGVCVRA